MKEFFRKKIVGLKRSPQIIPLLFILIACCIYTFSLTVYSGASIGLYNPAYLTQIRTDTGIDEFEVFFLNRNPAIYVFINTLCSILLPISFLSVYKKNKTNWFMYSIAIFMIVLMIVCNIFYISALNFYMGDIWGQKDESGMMGVSISRSIIHIVSLVISLVAILTKPLYSALFNKINTSVDDEYDRLMEQESEEDLLLDLDKDA